MRPVDDKYEVTQDFGSFATQGVVGDPNGSTVQQLVAQYGNYQPFGHAGQDIGTPENTPIRAIADGTVLWADWGSNLPGDNSWWGWASRWFLYQTFPGICTVIQHDGWISVYAHQNNNDAVWVGKQVKEGEIIGLSGKTRAPGVDLAPHLHIEALVDLSYTTGGGKIYGRVDPTPFYGTSTASNDVTPIEEDDMFSDEDRQLLKEARDRIIARDVQRWEAPDPANPALFVQAPDGQGQPSRSTDRLDVFNLIRRAEATDASVKALNDKLDAIIAKLGA